MNTLFQHGQRFTSFSVGTILIIVIVGAFFLFSPFTRADDSIVFKINISSLSACFNGIDDDHDGYIDSRDPECIGLMDNSEQKDGDITLEDLLYTYFSIPHFASGDIFGPPIDSSENTIFVSEDI